jgi:hypothetical protein
MNIYVFHLWFPYIVQFLESPTKFTKLWLIHDIQKSALKVFKSLKTGATSYWYVYRGRASAQSNYALIGIRTHKAMFRPPVQV